MNAIDKIFGGLVLVAVVAAVVSSRGNGSQAVRNVFGGTGYVFGSVLSPVTGTSASYPA